MGLVSFPCLPLKYRQSVCQRPIDCDRVRLLWQVLEYNAYWDDTDSLFGDVRLYKLQYYLSDDTLEIVEVLPRNCGRDPFPKFLRRMRLPKYTPITGAIQPGRLPLSRPLSLPRDR